MRAFSLSEKEPKTYTWIHASEMGWTLIINTAQFLLTGFFYEQLCINMLELLCVAIRNVLRFIIYILSELNLLEMCKVHFLKRLFLAENTEKKCSWWVQPERIQLNKTVMWCLFWLVSDGVSLSLYTHSWRFCASLTQACEASSVFVCVHVCACGYVRSIWAIFVRAKCP